MNLGFYSYEIEDMSRGDVNVFGVLRRCRLSRCSPCFQWRHIDVRVSVGIKNGDVPCERFAFRPRDKSGSIWSFTTICDESCWFLVCRVPVWLPARLCHLALHDVDVWGTFPAREAVKSSGVYQLATYTGVRWACPDSQPLSDGYPDFLIRKLQANQCHGSRMKPVTRVRSCCSL